MQIPSIPPPIVTNALAQDVVAKAVPNLQATPPLLQSAVSQAPKSEKSNYSRSNKDNRKDRRGQGNTDEGEDKKDEDGHTVNFSV